MLFVFVAELDNSLRQMLEEQRAGELQDPVGQVALQKSQVIEPYVEEGLRS